MVVEWLKFIFGSLFLISGVIIFGIELIGVFRFKYVLNRMHAGALGDTLGISLCLVGLIIMCGFSFTSLKLFLVVLFLWFSSPTASHLIARFEITTNEDKEKHYDHIKIDKEDK